MDAVIESKNALVKGKGVVIDNKRAVAGGENVIMEMKKQQMLALFEASGACFWKTSREIAAETQIKLEDVVSILTASWEFVESRSKRKMGDLVFTSRKVYEKRTPYWRLLLGILADRID
jgi:homoserine dehydrogenase